VVVVEFFKMERNLGAVVVLWVPVRYEMVAMKSLPANSDLCVEW
jgi:hypothetical protein